MHFLAEAASPETLPKVSPVLHDPEKGSPDRQVTADKELTQQRLEV